MILEEKFLPIIREYCLINNIPIENGRIPNARSQEIRDYILNQLDQERKRTKEVEKQNDYLLKNIIKRMLGGVTVLDSPIEQYLWDALET
jgi:hypothetical protein